METYKNNFYEDKRGSLQFTSIKSFKQQFISVNHKNVIRGIHTSPYGKLITCLKGSFIDYVINFDSMKYEKIYLNKNEINQVYVPPNFGHCFLSLEEDSIMLYQLEGEFDINKEKNYHYKCPFINLDIPEGDYIISEKDNQNPFYKSIDYIVIGSNGFLGGHISKTLKNQNKSFINLNLRLENVDLIRKNLSFYKPKYVICAAGISGKPTTQWCEEHKNETFSINVLYQLNLVQICKELNIHITLFLSGLLYQKGIYKEEDKPNYEKLYYSKCRAILEENLKHYDNYLGLRIMYPISMDGNPKCFMSKLLTRKDIHNVPVNITFIPSLFPKITELIENETKGIYNFVNEGEIYLGELMNIYNSHINIIEYNLIEKEQEIGLLDISKLKKVIKVGNIKNEIFNYIL